MYEQGANQLAPFANKTRERAALQFSVEYVIFLKHGILGQS